MKKILIVALLLAGLFAWQQRRQRAEIARLEQNRMALAQGLARYRNRFDREVASVQVLRLRCAEFEQLRRADAERLKGLGYRLRRLEAAARQVTRTQAVAAAPLCDTVVVRDTVRDTLRLFRWRDAWVRIEGAVAADSVLLELESVDTLHQLVHRIPRRFLFFRWGTKAIRQEIWSSNPHTRIVYSEYVRIER